jgi:membrane-bound serine protease (ClpP class)
MSRPGSGRGIDRRWISRLRLLLGAIYAGAGIVLVGLAAVSDLPVATPSAHAGAALVSSQAAGSQGSTAASQSAAAESSSAPLVYLAPVDSVIHPISAEFISDALDAADASNAAVIIFILETPGGLVESTRSIITKMLAARTPVVVYVGPGAARAASAGFLITIAADVAVMGPAAHIGAAHPVTAGGGGGGDEKVSDTMQQKIASDIAAYARSLASTRKRNVPLSEEAVIKSRAFTADEALSASPPLIDFISPSVDDVIAKLDNRSITRFDGRHVTLHTAKARRETIDMSARQRFLSALAHPQIAYILFTLGLLGLTVELWNPGSVFPGVAGGLCLLLAFLAFQVLPINTTGLLLIIFGLFLLILEIKIPSFGVLGVGGGLSLILGSLIMMNRSEDIRVSLEVIIPAMVAFAGIFLFLGRLALAAQRLPTVTGPNAMVGEIGRALTAIPSSGQAGEPGRVAAHGEIWNARTIGATPVSPGEAIRIIAVDGLTLTVEAAGSASVPSSASSASSASASRGSTT